MAEGNVDHLDTLNSSFGASDSASVSNSEKLSRRAQLRAKYVWSEELNDFITALDSYSPTVYLIVVIFLP